MGLYRILAPASQKLRNALNRALSLNQHFNIHLHSFPSPFSPSFFYPLNPLKYHTSPEYANQQTKLKNKIKNKKKEKVRETYPDHKYLKRISSLTESLASSLLVTRKGSLHLTAFNICTCSAATLNNTMCMT